MASKKANLVVKKLFDARGNSSSEESANKEPQNQSVLAVKEPNDEDVLPIVLHLEPKHGNDKSQSKKKIMDF